MHRPAIFFTDKDTDWLWYSFSRPKVLRNGSKSWRHRYVAGRDSFLPRARLPQPRSPASPAFFLFFFFCLLATARIFDADRCVSFSHAVLFVSRRHERGGMVLPGGIWLQERQGKRKQTKKKQGRGSSAAALHIAHGVVTESCCCCSRLAGPLSPDPRVSAKQTWHGACRKVARVTLPQRVAWSLSCGLMGSPIGRPHPSPNPPPRACSKQQQQPEPGSPARVTHGTLPTYLDRSVGRSSFGLGINAKRKADRAVMDESEPLPTQSLDIT